MQVLVSCIFATRIYRKILKSFAYKKCRDTS